MNAWRRQVGERILTRSLFAAAREQGLSALMGRLEASAGDLAAHYTSFSIDSSYLKAKVLAQHAFQVDLAGRVFSGDVKSVVDVGDSSGLHTKYLQSEYPSCGAEFLSVNLDDEAVERVRRKGLQAERIRAEELSKTGRKADVMLLFETLEHLTDPFRFLHALSSNGCCGQLVLTVPFVRRSRLGLHHIRAGIRRPVSAERLHFLELCPEDWRLLFRQSGWTVERERTYLQYPRHSVLRLTRWIWARWDFEGFYGAVLKPDDSWSSLYSDW